MSSAVGVLLGIDQCVYGGDREGVDVCAGDVLNAAEATLLSDAVRISEYKSSTVGRSTEKIVRGEIGM